MSDIFLSYASESRPRAALIARALQARGWSVWWDRDIPIGAPFADVIARELAGARCVVVLWSQNAHTSNWVRDEAEEGRRRNILIPVRLDPVEPPLGFRSIQAASLVNWDGSESSSELNVVFASVAKVCGPPSGRAAATAPGPLPQMTDRDRVNRDRILQRVKTFWITGVLEQSLHHTVRIELGLESAPGAVEDPWDAIIQEPDRSPRPAPPGTRVSDTFREVGGTLLILGAPGSGKTTLLLELARDLVDRANREPSHAIPIVFVLSSWVAQRRAIDEWLIDELRDRYNVPETIGRRWVDEDRLLLLLDGLDEVADEHREACVIALNSFRRRHPLVPIAICSRTDEYGALSTRLFLSAAIKVQPLTRSQVADYLANAGGALEGIQQLLSEDATVWELLDTPLMLSIMALAYQGASAKDLLASDSLEGRRERLFAAYTKAMFKRRGKPCGFAPEQTIEWLASLAASMAKRGQSVFYVESLQPDWLPRRGLRWIVPVAATAALGIAGLLSVSFWGLERLERSAFGGVIGLMLGVFWTVRFEGKIQAVELVSWSWRGMGKGLLLGQVWSHAFVFLIVPAGSLFLDALESWSDGTPLRSRNTGGGFTLALFVAVTFGLIAGLAMGTHFALKTGEVATRIAPNEGIRRSVRNALVIGTILMLVSGIVLFWFVGGLREKDAFGNTIADRARFSAGAATMIGLFTGMWYGGFASVQHLILRLLLWRTGAAPFNYVAFLNHATERIFLRRVGGGFIFVHRLLLEYFAARARAT